LKEKITKKRESNENTQSLSKVRR